MAGTRGLAGFRGEQLRPGSLRDSHFDVGSPINENKVAIQWHNHREVLQDTKVDVYIQVNSKTVSGLGTLDVTTDLNGYAVSTGVSVEGLVLTEKTLLRRSGTPDSPVSDATGNIVYGKLRQNGAAFLMDFFSAVNGTETPYTFPTAATPATVAIDYKFALRTNMSVVPVDAFLRAGGDFVQGATDADAYLNIQQIVKDLYGASGKAFNDGNAHLVTPIQDQINALSARTTNLENEPEEEVYEASGGETSYTFKNGVAKAKTVRVSINGALQAPGINFVYTYDANNHIDGINFAPDTLKMTNGVPDVLFIQYSKIV